MSRFIMIRIRGLSGGCMRVIGVTFCGALQPENNISPLRDSTVCVLKDSDK